MNINYAGMKKEVVAKKGGRLMDQIKQTFPEQMELFGYCQGDMDCSSCKIYVSHDVNQRLPELTDEEKVALQSALVDKRLKNQGLIGRLSCQIVIEENLSGSDIYVPLIF